MYMRGVLSWSLGLLTSFSHWACTTPVPSPRVEKGEAMNVIHGQPQASVWFDGSVQSAFQKAKQDNKLVFLYWGAVWCPPCNELKANVFSKPRFAELMQTFIPVYLDGDTEQAQIWGEKLQISGYPTVLVLDAAQSELFRLNSSVNLEEFEQVVTPLVGESQNFAAALARVQKKQAQMSDWRVLAFADWEQLPSASWPQAEKLRLLQQAVAEIPKSLSKERSLLAAQWLRAAAAAPATPELKGAAEARRRDAAQALAAVFLDRNTILASRMFVNNEAGTIANWLYPKPGDAAYEKLKQTWLAAAQEVAADETASIDTRLWAVNPELAFFRHEHKGEKVPAPLRERVQAAVQLADQRAQEPFTRHSAISGAAYLLRQVADYEGARRLLLAEAASTDTPWYYYSSLSALEQETGQSAEAKKWAAKARESAQGRASKLQWITSDISLNAKLQSPEQKPYLLTVTREFYELATQLDDGFAGRNRKRAETVKESLRDYRSDQDFTKLFGQYQKRCEQLQGENQNNCQQHFKSLL